MTLNADQLSQQIRAQLKILDPEISAEPLTPERKIIDTVAEVVAESSADTFVLNYAFDIDTKVGDDLDRFVALFGFARQAGRRAVGTVTFGRATNAPADIFIQPGTLLVRPGSSVEPQVNFVTTAPAIIYAGTTEADAIVEATEVGPSGNVSARTITTLGSGSSVDVSSVQNAVATAGGSNFEGDAELRARFKNTIFRNIAGTRDQYLALAIASRFSKKANVVGPISRFVEYLQVPASLILLSQIPYAKFTYTFDAYLTDGDPAAETFYNPNGADYTFNTTVVNPQTIPRTAVAPTATVVNQTNLPVGSVVLLEHSYCSINSRNDPANNVANKVDVFVSGLDSMTATESVIFPGSGNNTNFAASANKFYYKKFARDGTNSYPAAASRIQELLWQPILELPSAITIGVQTYTLGTDYFLLHDVTDYKGSRRARDVIEWSSAAIATIAASATFSLTYTFNRLPLALNELMDAHKQVTGDVLVHGGTLRYLNVNIILMYSAGFAPASVDAAITVTLNDFFDKLQFGALIQLSDVEDIIHNVPGVDNIRIATASDGVSYGLQEVGSNGVTLLGLPYTNDFALQDSDLPVLNKLVTTRRSQNTWSFT